MSGLPLKSCPSTSRACGACTVCCFAPAIEPLQKPTGVRCQYLTINGCGVYHERPKDSKFKDCIEFRCMWLDGWAETSDRPDQIGAAFVLRNGDDFPGQKRMHVIETAPGSAGHPRIRQLIDRVLAEGTTVVVANAQYVIALKPNGSSWRYAVDPTDALKTHVDPKTAPVQLTARGRRIG